MRTHQPYGLKGIANRVVLHVVTVPAQPVSQNNGVHSKIIKVVNKIAALGADIQTVMSATSREDNRRPSVASRFHSMNFDGRIVDIGDALNASRCSSGHCVVFSITDSLLLQVGRSWRVKSQD